MKKVLELHNLTHNYDPRTTAGISDINISIRESEIVSLIGPSGSGKSTTLKCVANIISNYKGEINIEKDEEVAYVDQHPNLNDNESVFENIKNAIKGNVTESQAETQIRTSLSNLELTNEIHSKISQLSGGQKQRVIIAQALVNNPSILLLDEPFANLDNILRASLLEDLFSLFKEKSITVLWVTHNTDEALSYSDRIMLLNFGKVQQIDTPYSIFNRPNNLFTASFFGESNIYVSKVFNTDESSNYYVNILDYKFPIINKDIITKSLNELLVVIPPNTITISKNGNLKGTVERSKYYGSHALIELSVESQYIWIKYNPLNTVYKTGDFVTFSLDYNFFHYLGEV